MDREDSVPERDCVVLDARAALTLAELSRACAVHAERIIELVEEGILSPSGREPQVWRFSGVHLRRARVVLRLERDLGVNLAGAALAIQLLEEVDALQARLKVLCGG
jgi:chaperone modulatory protein CbpM